MGRHTNVGQLVPHDVMNGIDRTNIASELTEGKWETKAIIRDGNYVWELKGAQKKNREMRSQAITSESMQAHPHTTIKWTSLNLRQT